MLDDQVQAARVAILILRDAAAVSSRPVPDRVRVDPLGEIVDDAGAARLLAGLEKPLVCSPEPEGLQRVIRCRSAGAERRRAHEHFAKEVTRNLFRRRWIWPSRRDDGQVLLVTETGRMLVSAASVRDAIRDYILEVSYAPHVSRAGPAERSLGAEWVMEITRLPGGKHVPGSEIERTPRRGDGSG